MYIILLIYYININKYKIYNIYKTCNKWHILTYIYMEFKRWYWWTYFQGSNGDADIENKHMDMGGGEEGESESESEGRFIGSDSLRPHGL